MDNFMGAFCVIVCYFAHSILAERANSADTIRPKRKKFSIIKIIIIVKIPLISL